MIRGARALTCTTVGLSFGLLCVLMVAAGCGRLPSAPRSSASAHMSGSGTATVGDDGSDGVVMMVRPGASPDQIASQYGGTVVAVVPELGLYRVVLPPGDDVARCAQAMMTDARVSLAEVNETATIAEGQQSSVAFSEGTRTWLDVYDQGALTRVGAARAQVGANGGNVLVAILDTGIALDHPALSSRLSLPGIEIGVTVSPGAERAQHVDSNHDGIVDGALGHGTHVAGIVLAVAPQARLLPVRVLDSDGVGNAFDVANGVVQASLRGAQVINMSLGMSAASTAVQTAIRFARDRGAVVVAPTGNDHLSRLQFPASMPEVFAVAGLDSADRHSGFTNFGFGTDISAPSVGILSTYFGGGYARWSGTSMAAPFVSGTAALLCGLLPRGPGAPDQVEELLLEGASPLDDTDPAFAAELGAGRVDASGSLNAFHHATGSGVSESQRWK